MEFIYIRRDEERARSTWATYTECGNKPGFQHKGAKDQRIKVKIDMTGNLYESLTL